MCRPLINGFDKYWIYTFVDILLPFCQNVSPNFITFMSIICKFLIINNFTYYNSITLCSLMTFERFFDCLDGEIARKFDKCTTIGHYLDKISDFIYWNLITIFSAIFLYNNPTFTIYWWIYFIILSYIPSAVVLDVFSNKWNLFDSVSKQSWFIYAEDNGSLFSILIPYMMYNIIS